VQLVDATTGADLWAERFDRPLRDIFAVQDEIVQKIVTTVGLIFKLKERGIPPAARIHGTDNLETYDYLLRGTYYSWSGTQEGNAKARVMWEKAIKLDPKCADAYVGLAWTYFLDAWNGWIDSPELSSKQTQPDLVESQERALNRAYEIVHQAIALDDSLPSAYVLLSQIDMYKGGHYAQGIANAERAIALDPNSGLDYFFLADALDITGKPEEAIAALNALIRLIMISM
jgi:adenylate cyclase